MELNHVSIPMDVIRDERRGRDRMTDQEFKEWSAKLGEALLKNLAHNSAHADEVDDAKEEQLSKVQPMDLPDPEPHDDEQAAETEQPEGKPRLKDLRSKYGRGGR